MNKQDADIIPFFLKSTKEKHIKEYMNNGKFYFFHPSVFNQWESRNSAQYDRWDAHSAYNATHLMYAPIVSEKDGKPVYGSVKQLADRAIIHEQSSAASHSPICCFRMVEEHEVEINHDCISFSLGSTAERILNEFGHDTFILIQATPFLERLKKKTDYIARSVVYRDTLNDFDFQAPEQISDVVEQLFRKDEEYEWQKEFRIALPPSKNSPVVIELGSIEDIAICGNILDLKN